MVKISPSLFQFEEQELPEAVKRIPNADLIHIDVTDGGFVRQEHPSLFYDVQKVALLQRHSSVPLDVHLMVINPFVDVDKYAALKPKPEYISFHIESSSDPEDVIKKIRKYGIKPAIAVNPRTSLAEIEHLLGKVDMVLLMSVIPGLPGQKYIENTNRRIAQLKTMIDEKGLDTLIEVDGGIKLDNVNYPISAGADVIVSGTGIFSHKKGKTIDKCFSPEEVIDKMRDVQNVILFGSDHAGYGLKEKLKKYLEEKDIPYKDLGCYNEDSVDYPDYADKVAKAILSGEYQRGVLICGSGIGISIRANRYSGIRAGLCHDENTAEMSRRHNNSNVLVMGGNIVSIQKAKKMFDIWYSTGFDGNTRKGERHKRRETKLDGPTY
ncbi:MAG: ribose 5-phosphate isomerase B, partial [Candidatus Woesearchaeota archaeon]